MQLLSIPLRENRTAFYWLASRGSKDSPPR